MKKVKSHTTNVPTGTDKKSGFVNPFIQMMEDKMKIADAFQKGSHSTPLKISSLSNLYNLALIAHGKFCK